jgi:hypothetical protein
MSGRKETAPPQRYPANNSKGSPETRKGLVQVDARTGKNPARYSLKAKQPLAAPKTTKKAAKSEEKPRVVRGSGAGEKQKPTRTPDASIADPYMIDATDDEIEINVITASQKRRKAGAKANNKAAPKKIGARKRKLAQTDPRQKRSAPAQAEKPTVTSRGRRRAANDAALKIRKAAASEIDIEDAENSSDEEEPEVTTKAANDEKTPCRSSIQAAIEDREHEGRQGSGTSLKKARCYLNIQQDNATDSWPHDDDQMALRPESESELYDISPKRPVDTAQYISQPSMDSLVSGSKRKSDGADYFSLKLGDMLACIDNELAPQNMQEKLKLKDDADLKHICDLRGVSNHHLKDGSKPGKMVNPSSSPSKEIPPRNPEERRINESHNEGSSKHSKSTNVEAAASVLQDLAERQSVVGLPGAHHSPADEAPFQHGIDDQISTQQEESFVQAAPIDKIVEQSKNSTPARPTDVGDQVTPDVEGTRKAVHEVLFSAKRKRVRDETQASSVPTWPSQHLSNQAKKVSQALNDFLSDKPLLDDRLTRKVHIVTFGVNGALNQGLASTLRSSDIRGANKEPVDNGGSPAGKRMKRMSEFAINSNSEAEIPNRPIKRRSVSPEVDQGGSQASEDACLDCSGSPPMIQDQIRQASKLRFQESRDHRDRSRAEGNLQIRRNSPSSSQRSRDIQNRDPAESQNQDRKTSRPSLQLSRVDQKGSPFARDHQTRRTFKSSSQASRADENGSPRALVSAERVDHFSRVKRKLLGDFQPADDGKTDLARNLFKIFEPRTRLSIPKTGPSSPQNVESRYVKHQKIENGLYEGVETKEVVVAEDSMADPFVGRQAKPTSNFTDQLQAGFASENCTPATVHRRKKAISIPNQTARISETPLNRKANVVVNNQEGHSRLPQTTSQVFTYEEQTTPGNEEQLISSSTDLTSSSTVPENEFPPNEDRSDTWNLALRPHYHNLSIMAHRLADVCTFPS